MTLVTKLIFWLLTEVLKGPHARLYSFACCFCSVARTISRTQRRSRRKKNHHKANNENLFGNKLFDQPYAFSLNCFVTPLRYTFYLHYQPVLDDGGVRRYFLHTHSTHRICHSHCYLFLGCLRLQHLIIISVALHILWWYQFVSVCVCYSSLLTVWRKVEFSSSSTENISRIYARQPLCY